MWASMKKKQKKEYVKPTVKVEKFVADIFAEW